MRWAPLICTLLLGMPAAGAVPERGSFTFRPLDGQQKIPERYRLTEHTFPYELTPQRELVASEVQIYHLTFPSVVTTPYPENNTVHAEYYRPRGAGRFPAVIVLDILAGSQIVPRTFSACLAQEGVACLFVQMAYYGPRRPTGKRVRMLSPNVEQSLEAIRQTVLDLRAAAAWLESRPELDPHRLGILGTSLGSFIAALTAEMEPRLERVVVLLGGGGVVDAYYNHPRAAPYRKMYEALGGTKEKLARRIAPADPLTCAANLKAHRLLILAGTRDEIVPPAMPRALWDAAGRQKIVWYDCGHYSAVLYLVAALDQIARHLTAD